MYSVELKIKRKNLADEAQDIRKEERAARTRFGGASEQYTSLHNHRTGKVRRAARHANLAHAFLRGYAYKDVERPSDTNPPDSAEVARLVRVFGIPEAQRHHDADRPCTGRDAGVYQFLRELGGEPSQSTRSVRGINRWIDGLPLGVSSSATGAEAA